MEAQTDAHYATAVASGSTCGTLLFALYRSYVAHYKGRFEEQAALLQRLHPVADELAGCTAKIYFLVELGVASGLAGKTAEARRALDSAAEDRPRIIRACAVTSAIRAPPSSCRWKRARRARERGSGDRPALASA